MMHTQKTFEYDELLERCMGNLDFVERILSRFETRLDDDIEELRQHIADGDVDDIVRVAHRIKGASTNTSAPRLQMQAAQIERLARDGQLEQLPLHLERLKEEGSKFSQSVSTLLPRQAETVPT